MSYKLIDATDIRNGTTIMVDGQPCTVRSYDVSKTGKHGHAKVRLEAIGILDGKKRVLARPGHERFEVPLINKKKAQILSIGTDKVNVMDVETFETMDLPKPTEDIEGELKEGEQVEYWEIDDIKVIKRIM
ncbi:MAG: translation initiation factor IF-5A [Candidatus Pacearchaeota archaeon]|jgi:translation initiation factor 5A